MFSKRAVNVNKNPPSPTQNYSNDLGRAVKQIVSYMLFGYVSCDSSHALIHRIFILNIPSSSS